MSWVRCFGLWLHEVQNQNTGIRQSQLNEQKDVLEEEILEPKNNQTESFEQEQEETLDGVFISNKELVDSAHETLDPDLNTERPNAWKIIRN